jgi:hypothetical protein
VGVGNARHAIAEILADFRRETSNTVFPSM